MTIRKYTDNDHLSILELLRLNTPAYFAPDEEEDLLYYLDGHSDNFYVIEVANEVVCCGGFNIKDDPAFCWISWDIVHPDFQGKGYGTELMKFRIEKIKEIPGVTILSVRTSQLTDQFYARFGMKVREIVKDYWAPGFDMVRMDCNLDSVQLTGQ
jgi:[ribosomal protein S18]-alanine N-acetyltransferase